MNNLTRLILLALTVTGLSISQVTLLSAVAQTTSTPDEMDEDIEMGEDIEMDEPAEFEPETMDSEASDDVLPQSVSGCVDYLDRPEVRTYLLEQWNTFFDNVLPAVNEARAESGLSDIEEPRDRADRLYRNNIVDVLCRP